MHKFFYIEDEKGKLHRYTSPVTWNELTEKHLLMWAGICLQRLSLDMALRAGLLVMCGIPEKFFFKLADDQLKVIAPRVEFLFGKNRLTNWVIPKFKHRGVWYHGPGNCLGNLSIKEFRRTEIYYQHYLKTGDVKHLRLLVATLYRPAKKGLHTDDIREDLFEQRVFARADLFKGYQWKRLRFKYVKVQFLQAVLLNYEGCRGFVHEQFPRVFVAAPAPRKAPFESLRVTPKHTKIFDLEDIIDTVAGGAFGDAAATENINVYRFFKHLTKSIESADKLKRK